MKCNMVKYLFKADFIHIEFFRFILYMFPFSLSEYEKNILEYFLIHLKVIVIVLKK